ncbi:Methylaspartate ammonia-lyase [Thermosinus carboxydivorans Nor1]|uniref:methylaspartate ammonia-lyase n=1 Tax=Thermosinus carboxydivorans Nor1 TaxID=401526 RepID=A1HQG5_9FIRM|nr:methylaspartate ammonia-lyase [Thermosinus carboxydivorans]EAX47771.1 Methylaspartate ammonia-lyase [Thermosinus carboxydivorans Nor1]
MKIMDVVCAKGMTGFYFDDQRAIKAGAAHDGFTYLGEPITPGFTAVRQAGEAVSVMLVLEDGQVAYGDCAAVQYSGAGGRDPLFLANDFIPLIEEYIKPRLVGRELTSFRALAEEIDNLSDPATGKRIHTALRYGVTQAILDAVAKAKKKLMCEVIAEEYNTQVSDQEIPIFTQSGDDRYDNADKMIIKQAQVLPHGLINNVKEKLGENGEKLLEYVQWLKNRVMKLRTRDDYNPVLHIDTYGTIGLAFNNDLEKIVAYFAKLEQAAAPLKLRIEGPIDIEDRDKQIDILADLTARLHAAGIGVEVVADEWCNTYEDIKLFADRRAGDMLQIKTPDLGGINNIIEAILYCKQKGIGAYQGGTCNETDRSAQVCVHIAMATQPAQMLAKPGMGVDEGYMIVYNEMQRILALRRARKQ